MKRVTVAGHSLHPMLVVFPLGLLTTSFVWDLVYLESETDPGRWSMISFWTIIAGLVGGLLAAVPGFLDFLHIPEGTRAKRVATVHGLLNVTIVGLFLISVILRIVGTGYQAPTVIDMLPGWFALSLALLSAWLGGELVERLGIGVANFQDVNAPSSLRKVRPTKQTTRMESTPPPAA